MLFPCFTAFAVSGHFGAGPLHFLHNLAHTERAAHEIYSLHPFQKAFDVRARLFPPHPYGYVPEVFGYVERIAFPEVCYGMPDPVLQVEGLERYDARYALELPVQFVFGVLLSGNLRPDVLHGPVVPFVLPHGLQAVGCGAHDFHGAGKVLHHRPVHLHEYLRGILTGLYFKVGMQEKFHGLFPPYLPELLAKVAVTVQETAYLVLHGTVVPEERGEAQADIIPSMPVRYDLYILHHRETGQYRPAVVLCRDRRRRIHHSCGKEAVPFSHPCAVSTGKVILWREVQLVVDFR